MTMSPRTVLIIEPSIAGLQLLSTAKKMGLHVVAATACSDERIIPSNYMKHIDDLLQVDTNDFEALSNGVSKYLQKRKIDAVIPGFENYVPTAFSLFEKISFKIPTDFSPMALRVKSMLRRKLSLAGLSTIKYFEISNVQELLQAASQINFPAVIKPVDNSGSIHVSKVRNSDELLIAYQSMCSDTWTEMGKSIGNKAILEEYLSGEVFSVEGFINNGVPVIFSITKKINSEEPFFVEMGHIVEANLLETERRLIINYVESVLKCLHVFIGAFHCELVFTSQGPEVVEVANRLAGGRICDLIRYALNINLYEATLCSFLGITYSQEPIRRKKWAGIKFFGLEPGQEYYSNIEGVDRLKELHGFFEFKIILPPRTKIPPLTSFRGRVAYTIFGCDDYNYLEETLIKATNIIRFRH